MEYKFSNPIDIFGLKKNEIANYEGYTLAGQRQALDLLESTRGADPCPICNTENSHIAVVVHGFQYKQCENCTHVYQVLPIPIQRIEEVYTATDVEFPYSDIYAKDAEVQRIRFDSAVTPRVEYVSSFLSERLDGKPKSWLDIGCGNGGILAAAKSKGFEVTGIEISATLVEVARRTHGIDLFHGTLLEYYKEHKQARYDVVSFIGLLHSLPDIQSDMEVASELVTDSGLFVTNASHYNSLTMALQQSYSDQPVRFCTPNVYHLFTEQSLQEFARRHGFEPVGMWYFGMDVYELINTLSLESFRFRHSRAKEILVNLVNELQSTLDVNQLSDEIFMVAMKV